MRQPRVLEIGGGQASAYAAKLLGDHGADVVKVEPPTGDPVRQLGPFRDRPDPNVAGLFLALNQNKRAITLDFESAPESLAVWLQWADIVVHGYGPAHSQRLSLDSASMRRDHPGAVVLAISPFGSTGAYADYQATELTLINAGGWANVCPATHEDPNLPPLKVYGDQCQLMAAISGAAVALATWQQTARTGIGEFIDFSVQSYVASVLEAALPALSYRGEVASRSNLRSLIPWRIFQAKDAPVFVVCIEQDQWERLVEFMGSPEWATMEVFADQPSRQENQDLVHFYVQEFVQEWQAQDLYHAAQKHRICVAPVFNLQELATNEHLHARDFFVATKHPEHGEITYMAPAALTTQGRGATPTPAPSLGEHNETAADILATAETPPSMSDMAASTANEKPLSGIRVLDLTWAWAGPFCSMNLAHMGAEVVRIESEMRADLYRRLPVYPPGIEEGLNCSGMFNQWNQGKRSLTLDLSTEQGIAIVRDLVKVSDVVVQNFATGVMDRLGLNYDTLKAINPKIIMASISGYGQSGPYREYMGYGPAIPPLTGLSHATGYADGEAEEIGLSMPDPTAGITAAWQIVSALHTLQTTGVGEHLDVTLWESTAVLNAEGWMGYAMNGTIPQRMTNRSVHMSPHGVYPARRTLSGEDTELDNDRWIAISCRDDAEWRALAAQIDSALLDDPRFATLAARRANEDALDALVADWCKDQDRWQLTEQLQALGIAAFPTMDTADVIHDPHLIQRGFIETLPHPEVGGRAHSGIPWIMAERPNGVASAAPCLDADTDDVLADWLNMDDASVANLREQGITGC